MQPVSEYGVWSCSECGRRIELFDVVTIEAARYGGNPGGGGIVRVEHICPCVRPGGRAVVNADDRVRYSILQASPMALISLFGKGHIELPYTAPWKRRAVAADDQLVSRWAWELSQTADCDEFLFWCEQGSAGSQSHTDQL